MAVINKKSLVFSGMKEIELAYGLLLATKSGKEEFSRTSIGEFIDKKYPNPVTHNFLKKMILLKVLVYCNNITYRGQSFPIYTIDRDKLLDVIEDTREFEILVEFYKERVNIVLKK